MNDTRQEILTRLTNIAAQAQKAQEAQNHEDVVRFYRDLLALDTLPGLKGLYAQAHYSIASALAQMGELEQAFEALNHAVQKGYTANDYAREDASFKQMRDDPRFAKALTDMKANQTRLKVYAITAWDNIDIPHTTHYFDGMDSAPSETLRTTYALPTLIQNAPSQLDAQKRILHWVHHRWAHSGLMEPSSPNALTILQEVEQGSRFRCVEYSIVLAQTLHALGFPARIVRLRCQGMSYGVGKGHVVSEVWNDDLQKWIILDGQNNTLWMEHTTPLSAHELQTRLASGTTAHIQMLYQGSDWQKCSPTRDAWLSYFAYIALSQDNRIFEKSNQTNPKKQILLHKTQTPELLFQGMPLHETFTRDAKLLYPTLNRVHVHLETPTNPSKTDNNVLKVHLNHTMPSFDHYTINDVPQNSEQPWSWTLQPGTNVLRVHAVNSAGIQGAPTRIALDYYPPT